ncbi:MAG: TolC family outer membrane protein [Paracoccaceae bacterium]
MAAPGIAERIGGGLAALALAVGLMAAPQSAAAETLADSLADAYENSGLLEQNRALLRAADEDVAASLAALRPVISWTSRLRRSFGETRSTSAFGTSTSDVANTSATMGVNLELLLYDFGASRMRTDAAKETVLATRHGLVSVEQQVLLRAVRAFMNVRRETENVALRQNNLRLIQEELRAAQDRFEVGEVTRTDVSLAEARLAGARANLAVSQGNLAQAVEEFRAAVGRAPGSLVPPSRLPETAATEAEAKSIAVRNHPDIMQAQREITVAELGVAIAEAAMKPQVSFGAGVSVTENFGSSNYNRGGELSLSASGPIYQGGQLSALLRQAMARRDAARAALHIVRLQVQQDAGNAFAQVRVAQAALEASERQISAAQVAFEGVREEAKLGARTTLDVLNAEQELLDARAGQISANADEYIAAYALLAAMGLMTADHLNLGVQRYDPSMYYNLVKDGPARSQQGEQLDRVLRALGEE